MKIERLSENQIRCTLNKADLAEKQLKISELAYGSPKTKELFREMMQQASNELGFETDDLPLMIEAVPVSPDCLILIVTKVEDPEELDARFSRFSKIAGYDEELSEDDEEDSEYGDEDTENFMGSGKAAGSSSIGIPESIYNAIEGLVNNIANISASSGKSGSLSISVDTEASAEKDKEVPAEKETIFRVIVFDSLNTVIKSSKQVAGFYFSCNTLYKNPENNKFYLLVTNDNNTTSEFNRLCCILSEYGSLIKSSYAMPYHFKEHYKVILQDDAVQTLSAL